MQSILEKLTKEELKDLSKAINKAQEKFFGNSLSLRKQEALMSQIFQNKNWSTTLGLCEKEKKYNKDGEYQRTVIEVEVLSNGFYNNSNNLKTIAHDILYGDCSGKISVKKRESLSKEEMSQALLDQGSDPEFLIYLDEEQVDLISEIYKDVDLTLEKGLAHEEIALQVKLILRYYEHYHKDSGVEIDKHDILLWLKREESFL